MRGPRDSATLSKMSDTGCFAQFKAQFRRDKLPPQSLRDFDDGHTWCTAFGTSSLQVLSDRRQYLRFRALLTLLISAIWIWGVAESFTKCSNSDGKFLIFLTNWTLTAETLYFWFALGTTWRAHACLDSLRGAGQAPPPAPWFMRATWALQSVALNGSFTVVVLFWGLLAPQAGLPDAMGYFAHGVNFLLAAADMYASRQPYYVAHVSMYAAFAACYVLFSLVYYGAGGTDCVGNDYVYPVLDWSKPGATVLVGVGVFFVGIPSFTAILFSAISRFPGARFQPPDAETSAPML